MDPGVVRTALTVGACVVLCGALLALLVLPASRRR